MRDCRVKRKLSGRPLINFWPVGLLGTSPCRTPGRPPATLERVHDLYEGSSARTNRVQSLRNARPRNKPAPDDGGITQPLDL